MLSTAFSSERAAGPALYIVLGVVAKAVAADIVLRASACGSDNLDFQSVAGRVHAGQASTLWREERIPAVVGQGKTMCRMSKFYGTAPAAKRTCEQRDLCIVSTYA